METPATPANPTHLRFGLFMPPYHNPRRNPTASIEQDLRHVEELDRLGYDEVWFGEHHSGGYEIIPSPEIMIAAAAQRTRRIDLCSGVISLPYHHPLMVADRIVFLDHLTRGRVRVGVGPGALVADSQMMGTDYNQLRPRMEEALDAILELLDTPGPVDRKTEWFTLDDARLQLDCYTRPRVRMSVAAALSPQSTSHMYELLADKVFPHFIEGGSALMNSYLWTKERKEGFRQRFDAGIAKAKSDYATQNATPLAGAHRE